MEEMHFSRSRLVRSHELHRSDMVHEAALQVGGLVRVPSVALGKLVNHADNFGQELFGFVLGLQATQCLDGSTGRFLAETVASTLFFVLADALLR